MKPASSSRITPPPVPIKHQTSISWVLCIHTPGLREALWGLCDYESLAQQHNTKAIPSRLYPRALNTYWSYYYKHHASNHNKVWVHIFWIYKYPRSVWTVNHMQSDRAKYQVPFKWVITQCRSLHLGEPITMLISWISLPNECNNITSTSKRNSVSLYLFNRGPSIRLHWHRWGSISSWRFSYTW